MSTSGVKVSLMGKQNNKPNIYLIFQDTHLFRVLKRCSKAKVHHVPEGAVNKFFYELIIRVLKEGC